ncbi:hypothetical protein DXG03_000127 [Asterophora parasitica]|uniref:SPRY domain-containing protein n=1 Tax=Asterophora parasitica TaxID=117018 RepID=A0A9P7KFP9_9AGAR|nr:hypothetical protein DXG03_000127 [Asterophora parasitica]
MPSFFSSLRDRVANHNNTQPVYQPPNYPPNQPYQPPNYPPNQGAQYGQPPPVSGDAPPGWAPAPEQSVRKLYAAIHSLNTNTHIQHQWGQRAEATEEDYQAAEEFCNRYTVEAPRLLSSDTVERISASGCKAWGLEIPQTRRFVGTVQNPSDSKSDAHRVHVKTGSACRETCILSDLPILAGLYDVKGKHGVYYEVEILEMDVEKDGVVAVGTACRPYPNWRLPGWNRLSGGLHLDDMCKFFEDPDGGRDYNAMKHVTVRPGDIVGCGYDFGRSSLFYTWNGQRTNINGVEQDAFVGVYLPRAKHDVYAAIGVSGAVEVKVNFGGELFRWKEGNEWAWRVEGHVGKLGGTVMGVDAEDLPSYYEASGSSRRGY